MIQTISSSHDTQNDEQKKILQQLELLTTQNRKIEKFLTNVQQTIEKLEMVNGNLFEQLNHIQSMMQKSDYDISLFSRQDDDDLMVDEMGQAPVKWWVKE